MALVVFGGSRRTIAALVCLLAVCSLAAPASAARKRAGKAWFGVAMSRAAGGGLIVEHVFPASPAMKMNLSPGDVLVSADQVPLDTPSDMVEHVQLHEPGMSLDVLVRKGGQEQTMRVVLEDYPGDDEVARLMHVGKPAIDPLDWTPVQGSPPSRMEDLHGRVVLLDFFASWCANCKLLAPQLARWHERYRGRGLTVLGVTSDGDETAREIVKSWKLPFSVASDVGRNAETAYRLSSIPAMLLIDKQGIVRDVRIGYEPKRRASIERFIEKLLRE